MTPKRMRNNSRFFLKVRNRGTWLKQAGTSDHGEGETKPAAETTRWLSEAQGFQTFKQAARMRDLLQARYGIRVDVVRFDGGRRYNA